MPQKKKLLIGEMLIERKLVTADELDQALKEQRNTGEFVGRVLIKLGHLTEEELLPILSEQLGIEYVSLKAVKIDKSIAKTIPAKFVTHYKIMPVKLEGNMLTIAMTDPLDINVLDDIKLLLGHDIRPVFASEKDITDTLNKYYGVGAETIESMMSNSPASALKAGSKTSNITDLSEDASIIKFVNQILNQAVRDRATDIHIEPYENELKVRFRIDGVLYDANIPPTIKHFQSALVSRIKIMADLNIAERRLPQDGRMKIKIENEEVDMRVSILPTPFGESVDLRILKSGVLWDIERLGFFKDDMKLLEDLIKRPHGIIFVTGPTGSGKTTTLYACLNKINKHDKKIITIEDPIEYQINNVTQIQIHPKIGLTFAQGLRSMLRHDPDIMMVGEVRDFETAEITIRFALTGHLVFSTIHTNDAAGGVTRLLDMGIEPYLVSSSVECFVAQRLVRLICDNCKREAKPSQAILEEVGLKKAIGKIYEGAGCDKCKFTGYRGRTAIFELLIIDDEIRQMILKRTSSNEIKKLAVSKGMKTLRDDGLHKVMEGLTTIAEVIRVTQQNERPLE
ncbi:MAG: type II secretion system protein GspE [Candidatus Omnitrophica bacterium CG1_02_49_10]|nr:MAG: type II secretion system protein GspE [Candidatus Omnitrophica bacterium CG1_02_49_10]